MALSSIVPSEGTVELIFPEGKGINSMSPDMPVEQWIFIPEKENMNFIIKNLHRAKWI